MLPSDRQVPQRENQTTQRVLVVENTKLPAAALSHFGYYHTGSNPSLPTIFLWYPLLSYSYILPCPFLPLARVHSSDLWPVVGRRPQLRVPTRRTRNCPKNTRWCTKCVVNLPMKNWLRMLANGIKNMSFLNKLSLNWYVGAVDAANPMTVVSLTLVWTYLSFTG